MKLGQSGIALIEVVLQCDLSRTALIAVVEACEPGGGQTVATFRLGGKSATGRVLTLDHEREVLRDIRDYTPGEFNPVYALWMLKAVTGRICKRYGIELVVLTVGWCLPRCVHTPQEPQSSIFGPSLIAVKQWLMPCYPAIARSAMVEGADLHWVEKTIRCSDAALLDNGAPQRQMPVIRLPNSRHSLSIVARAESNGWLRWKFIDDALSADIFIDFLARLVNGARQRSFLVLDSLPVHRAEPVKAWLVRHTEAVKVFYRPSNTIEPIRMRRPTSGLSKPPLRSRRRE